MRVDFLVIIRGLGAFSTGDYGPLRAIRGLLRADRVPRLVIIPFAAQESPHQSSIGLWKKQLPVIFV